MPVKFKIILITETKKNCAWKYIKTLTHILKLSEKPLQLPYIIVSAFETMMIKTDDQSKLEKIKNKEKMDNLP